MRIYEVLKEDNIGKEYLCKGEKYKLVYDCSCNKLDLICLRTRVSIRNYIDSIDIAFSEFEEVGSPVKKVKIVFENCETLEIDEKYLEVEVEGNNGRIFIKIKDYINSLRDIKTSDGYSAYQRLKQWGDITYITFSNGSTLYIPWECDDDEVCGYDSTQHNNYQYYKEEEKDFIIVIDRISEIEGKIKSLNDEIKHYEAILKNIKGE